MKRLNSYVGLDMYKEKNVVCVDNEKVTMFFAPNQNWTKKAIQELKERNVIFDNNTISYMILDKKKVVLGYEDDGVISFQKNKPNIMPKYENEFPARLLPDLIKVTEMTIDTICDK